MSATDCLINEDNVLERLTDERLQLDHRLDSLILLIYITLLALSVITIWTFKHRRFTYIHETGLSVIYGLIVGIALRYGMKHPGETAYYHELPRSMNSTCGSVLPPEKIIVKLPVLDQHGNFNLSKSFDYIFEGSSTKGLSYNYKATFNPEIFFNILLPPIIFTAGYRMKRRHFFQHLGAILTFAFFGTLVSSLVVGVICYGFSRPISSLSSLLSFSDCILFGAMISATDPVTVLAIFKDLHVDVNVYAIVFGESVLNDAVAIALSQSVDEYGALSNDTFDAKAFISALSHFFAMFGGSFAIGVIVSWIAALLTKFTHIREHPLLETTLFVLMSYSTFLIAETIGFTGIVAVLFCGITQAHYTYNNLSDISKQSTKQFFELLNFLAENFVFAYIGVSTFTSQHHYWDVRFVFIALFACVVARAASVYPFSFVINLCRGHGFSCPSRCVRGNSATDDTTVHHESTIPAGSPSYNQFDPDVDQSVRPESNRITMNMQHMLVFSGLRGAMAFSLAIRNTSSETRRMFFSTTLVIVMITVLLCGGLVKSMLQWLSIPIGVDIETYKMEDETTRSKRYATLDCFSRFWRRFDNRYLKPFLTHSSPPLTESLPQCCYRLTSLLTTSEQRANWLESRQLRPMTSESSLQNDNAADRSAVYFVKDNSFQNRISPPMDQSTQRAEQLDSFATQNSSPIDRDFEKESADFHHKRLF